MSIVKQREYYSKLISDAGKDQKKHLKIVNNVLDRNKEKVLPEYHDPKQLANDIN